MQPGFATKTVVLWSYAPAILRLHLLPTPEGRFARGKAARPLTNVPMRHSNSETRWWNREVAIKPVLAMVALSIVAACGILYFNAAFGACFWALTHHSKATHGQVSIKVPWMWKQEETPPGQREIRLVRERWARTPSLESIVISKDVSPPRPPQSIEQRLEDLASKIGQVGPMGNRLALPPEIAGRYSCMAPQFEKLREWQVSCISSDNVWSVNYFSPTSNMDEFLTVLRNLATAQRMSS